MRLVQGWDVGLRGSSTLVRGRDVGFRGSSTLVQGWDVGLRESSTMVHLDREIAGGRSRKVVR